MLPAIPYSAVLTIGRRVSHKGKVSVDGNLYSVPDTSRSASSRFRITPTRFEEGTLIAMHPVLEGQLAEKIRFYARSSLLIVLLAVSKQTTAGQ